MVPFKLETFSLLRNDYNRYSMIVTLPAMTQNNFCYWFFLRNAERICMRFGNRSFKRRIHYVLHFLVTTKYYLNKKAHLQSALRNLAMFFPIKLISLYWSFWLCLFFFWFLVWSHLYPSWSYEDFRQLKDDIFFDLSFLICWLIWHYWYLLSYY